MSRRRSARGFTLVELLVAITLLGLIAVALSGALRFGARVWDTGAERGAQASRVEATQNFLRRRIAEAKLFDAEGETPDERPGFIGEAERVHFVSLLPAHLGAGGYYNFELWQGEAPDGRQQLIIAWGIHRPDGEWDPEDAGDDARRVLIDNIEDAEIRYFGALEGEDDPIWHDAWDEPERLPQLISLDVAFPEGDGRIWPTLIVALKLAARG